jgi:hypothetical protein
VCRDQCQLVKCMLGNDEHRSRPIR